MLLQIDRTLFHLLNRGAANPFFDWLMPRITNLHHQKIFLVMIALICIYILARGSRRTRLWLLCALVAVGMSDSIAYRAVKKIVPRDRPCKVILAGHMAFADTRLIGECPGSQSFPSNHAANMAALGVTCFAFTRRKYARWLWLLIPLIIGYSRIYLGYHYPGDVLGGWCLGTITAAAIYMLIRSRLCKIEAES